jgi:integrase
MSSFKRGGVWWYEFVFQGQRIRQSSNSPIKDVCLRAERDRRRKLELGAQGLEAVAKPQLFSVAVKDFLLDQEAHWAPKTRLIHANSFSHLEPHFGKKLLFEIRRETISAYQRARQREGASGRSINIEIGLVRMVMDPRLWANIWNKRDRKGIMLKENRELGRELSDDEIKRLLSACKVSVSRGLYPAVLTSIHTGLRSSELRLLRWKQVDLPDGTMIVGKSKTEGGKGREVYLSALAVQTLQTWRTQFPSVQPSHAVFPREAYGLKGKMGTFGGVVVPYRTYPDQPVSSFSTAWGTAKKAAGVFCRWHDLRHSCTSRLAAGGATDQTLQALLGWMSPKMIERYSHVRAEAKRRAVAVFDVVASEPDSPQIPPQPTVTAKPHVM